MSDMKIHTTAIELTHCKTPQSQTQHFVPV